MPGGNTLPTVSQISGLPSNGYPPARYTDGFQTLSAEAPLSTRFVTSRYEAELELLVFAAWAGVELVSVPVRVFYPSQEERVTHFRQ